MFSLEGKHLSFRQESDGLARATERVALWAVQWRKTICFFAARYLKSNHDHLRYAIPVGSQEAASSHILDVAAPSELQGQRHHAFVSNVRHCANAVGGVQPARRGGRGSGPAT